MYIQSGSNIELKNQINVLHTYRLNIFLYDLMIYVSDDWRHVSKFALFCCAKYYRIDTVQKARTVEVPMNVTVSMSAVSSNTEEQGDPEFPGLF